MCFRTFSKNSPTDIDVYHWGNNLLDYIFDALRIDPKSYLKWHSLVANMLVCIWFALTIALSPIRMRICMFIWTIIQIKHILELVVLCRQWSLLWEIWVIGMLASPGLHRPNNSLAISIFIRRIVIWVATPSEWYNKIIIMCNTTRAQCQQKVSR